MTTLRRGLVLAGAVMLVLGSCNIALGFTKGNLLITNDKTDSGVCEFTPAGKLVQQLRVPLIDKGTAGKERRGLAVDGKGRLHIFNGTWQPYLSTYDPASGWSHHRIPGWTTANNTKGGGLAVLGDYVFVTDVATYCAPDDPFKFRGLIRFDTGSWRAIRFESGIDFSTLCMGLDGLLYAKGNSDFIIYVYNPISLAKVKEIKLAQAVSCIAVDSQHRLYGADQNKVYRFGPSGTVEAALSIPDGAQGFHFTAQGIALSRTGMLAVKSWSINKIVIVTDTSLAKYTYFYTEASGLITFVD